MFWPPIMAIFREVFFEGYITKNIIIYVVYNTINVLIVYAIVDIISHNILPKLPLHSLWIKQATKSKALLNLEIIRNVAWHLHLCTNLFLADCQGSSVYQLQIVTALISLPLLPFHELLLLLPPTPVIEKLNW